MGREASIAPKERINVTFKPATGGAVEEIELPMKVTVLGDFRHTHDDRPLLDRKPVGVNKNNFADVMEKQNLALEFAVPRKLQEGESDVDMQVRLAVKSMRDFEPENVIRQIPELEQLNRLRQALVSLKGPLGNLPAFRNALEEILKNPKQRDAILREVAEEGVDISFFTNPAATSGDNSGNTGKEHSGVEDQGAVHPAEKEKE